MIKVNVGNVLRQQEGIIVHGCNSKGVMNSGLAKEVREIFPGAFNLYRKTFEEQGLRLGEVIMYDVNPGLVIANAITQSQYGREKKVYVNYNAVTEVFQTLGQIARWKKVPLHFPLIGCGLANGDWKRIKVIIDYFVPKTVEKNLWVLREEDIPK